MITRRQFGIGIAGVAATTVGPGLAIAKAGGPTVTGPVPGTLTLALGDYDLAKLGYVVEEFFIAGTASSYEPVGALATDGIWQVRTASNAPYTTRIVVIRPADPEKFNGTVLVEWLNVSGLRDAAPDWMYQHREYLRSGFAYVGVSAQYIGVEGPPGQIASPPGLAPGDQLGPLKIADPARYSALGHPGDDFAYDIFSQAGQVVRGRHGRGVLGTLKALRFLAIGESQSAGCLVTYVNAVHPLAQTFDGYLIHSRGAGSAPLLRAPLGSPPQTPPKIPTPRGSRIRTDLLVPVMIVAAETDVANGFYLARQPDTDRIRTWEITGTGHADSYIMQGAWAIDSGAAPIALLAAALKPTDTLYGQKIDKPMNSGLQHHYGVTAAGAHLDQWVRSGKAPPTAQPISIRPPAETGGEARLDLDELGNAKGGMRSPWVDVPVARLSGVGNSGPGFARLVGMTETFDAATLAKLYPAGKAEYLRKFEVALRQTVKQGFILEADQAEALQLADAMYPQN